MSNSYLLKKSSKVVSFVVIMTLVFTTFFSMGTGIESVYASSDAGAIDSAVTKTIDNYYKTNKKGVIDDWEDLVAIHASGANLEDFMLPNIPKSGASSVIANLIIGNISDAENAAKNMVTEQTLSNPGYAYGMALNIIAIEAYNRSVPGTEIVYSTEGAISDLLNYRDENHIYINSFAEGNPPSSDDAGMALMAFSLFDGATVTVSETTINVSDAINEAVGQLRNSQLETGAFPGYSNANSTALAIFGLIAVDGDGDINDITTGTAINNPADGLIYYQLKDGGYTNKNDITGNEKAEAFATKQSALAMAMMANKECYYTTLSCSEINYITTELQVIDENGNYKEKKMTMGADKSVKKGIQRALSIEEDIALSNYKVYINGTYEENPVDINLTNDDKVLAVYKDFDEVAYFKTKDTDQIGVNTITVPFEGSCVLTLVKKSLASEEEVALASKKTNYGTAIVSDYGTTNADGKLSVTPVEAIEYEISAKRDGYVKNFETGLYEKVIFIPTNTAILPAKVVMTAGAPQIAENVSVRVEGPTENIINETINVARADGSRITVHDAVVQALDKASVQYETNNNYISKIDGITAGAFGTSKFYDGWMYKIIEPEYLDGTKTLSGMGGQFLSGGEEIVVYYSNDDSSTVYPFVTSKLNSDNSVTIEIKGYYTEYLPDWSSVTKLKPVTGVSIYWSKNTENEYINTTNEQGVVVIPKEKATIGQHSLQISKGSPNLPDVIRLAPEYNVGVSTSGSTGDDGHTELKDFVYLKVKGPYGNLLNKTRFAWYKGQTALSILQASGLTLETNGTGDYVRTIEKIGEFDLGVNSGWLYSINGVTPTSTPAKDKNLEKNDDVLWYYTKDYTKDSSSKKWNPTTEKKEDAVTSSENATGTTIIEAKTDKNGKATVNVPAKDINSAIDKVLKVTNKEENKNLNKEVQIEVTAEDKTSEVEAILSKASVVELDKKVDVVTLKTPLSNISLDNETLKDIAKNIEGDIKVAIAKVDVEKTIMANDNISAEQKDAIKKEIGTRPVFDFAISAGDKKVSKFAGKVEIVIPYTLDKTENPNNLVIYYVNDDGNLELVRNCVYDAKTKNVKFATNHFSSYAVGYREVSFADTTKHWAKNQIVYLAARNIVKGKAKTNFEPNSSITRAEFTQILANMSGADLNSYGALNFDDVKENAWYAKAAAWAEKEGVITGIKNSDGTVNFNGNANISRQDMAVMLTRYIEKVEKNQLRVVAKEMKFADKEQIGNYAQDAVISMQKAGIINGVKNSDKTYSFAPRNKATRAEASKMISTLIQSNLK